MKDAIRKTKAPYSRTRNRVLKDSAVYDTVYTYVTLPSGTPSVTHTGWSVPASLEVMNDTVTPAFEVLKGQGQIVASPMSRYYSKYEATPDSFAQTHRAIQNGVLVSGFDATWVDACAPARQNYVGWPSPSWLDPLIVANAGNSALVGAYAKLDETAWSSMVDLAELRATIDMLKKCKPRFMTLVRAFRRAANPRANGNRRRPPRSRPASAARILKKAGDNLSSATLEFLYGWIPLALSVEDAIKACQKLEPIKVRQTKTASVHIEPGEQSVTQTTIVSLPFNGTGHSYKETKSIEELHQRGGVNAELSVNWRHVFGLTLADVPSTVWELTPLSFVVDWFVHVGDWLTAWKVRANHRILLSWLTTTNSRVVTYTYYDDAPWVTTQTTGGNIYETWRQTSARRESLKIEGYSKERKINPPLTFLPPVDSHLSQITSLNHTIAGIALSYQALVKAFR